MWKPPVATSAIWQMILYSVQYAQLSLNPVMDIIPLHADDVEEDYIKVLWLHGPDGSDE